MSFSRRNLLKNVVAGAGIAMGGGQAKGGASSRSASRGYPEVPSGPDPLFEKPVPITLASPSASAISAA